MSSDSESNTLELDSTDPAAPVPPNGGLRAWMQVLGGHFLFFNSWGIVNSFGVFQTFYEDSLLSSKSTSEISWIGTFQAFLLMALSLVIGPLFDRGYVRSLLFTGTFLTVFGMMMTSLATEYWQIFLAQGFCVGIGTSLIFIPSLALVATYFTTKRALAIGIVASGGSVGSVIYPIIFVRLQPHVGFPWATRVMGFVVLVSLSISLAVMKGPLYQANKSRPLLYLSAFRNIPYSLFTLGLFLIFAGLYVPIFYEIVWAQVHANVDTDLSFYLLVVLNAASAIGRVVPGLFADKLGPLEVMTTCTIIAAVLAYVGVAVHNLGGVIVFSILYGFASGSVVSLPSPVLATIIPDMEIIGTLLGMSFFIAGIGILIGSPIAGTIINVAEDQFSGGFIFSGSLVIAAAVSFLGAKVYMKSSKPQPQVKA